MAAQVPIHAPQPYADVADLTAFWKAPDVRLAVSPDRIPEIVNKIRQ